jgi:hypothetical protein
MDWRGIPAIGCQRERLVTYREGASARVNILVVIVEDV